jgi:Ca2+-transporting ATPase
LDSPTNGLSSKEAVARAERYGPNSLGETAGAGLLGIFLGQFKDFMIGVLLVAALISGFIGEAKDTIVIIVIVVLNAVVGFVQEYRSEKAMEALRDLSAPQATVWRDNEISVIDAAGLVPGDIVKIEAGEIVPADMRLLNTAGLQVDESTLTGESVPTLKISDPLAPEKLPLGDRLNLVYSGTIVTAGHGRGI